MLIVIGAFIYAFIIGYGIPQHELSSNTMALITSDWCNAAP